MTPSEKKKLAKQVLRLCEKQYRKGFQQGFRVGKNEWMTEKQVSRFREVGSDTGYRQCKDPLSGRKYNQPRFMESECAMGDMNELIDLLCHA